MDKIKLAIEGRIQDIINNIQDDGLKKETVHFWLVDYFNYFTKLNDIAENLEKNKIGPQQAYEISEKITDNLMRAADGLEVKSGNKFFAKKMKKVFRDLTGPLGYKGKILKRAFEKPRGYPGDYLTIEYIYGNSSISEGIGYCSDMYLLNNQYANAVRNRKDLMKDILLDFIMNSRNSNLDILNIACGSSREVEEMFLKNNNIDKALSFKLVDHDKEALDFSKKLLMKYQNDKVKFEFLAHNVLEYIKEPEKYTGVLGKQDLIYSIGLADYLPDRLLKKLIVFWYGLLKQNGSLIFAHKDRTEYKPVPIDWWADWTFYPRDEKSLLGMMVDTGIKNYNVKIIRERSNIIFFLIINKL